MKIPQFRDSSNYTKYELEKDLEPAVGISMTVPDQTIPLKELIERHTRGLPVPTFVPLFSDEELPNIQKMDLAEIEEYKRQLAEDIEYYQSQLQQSDYEEVKAENIAPESNEPTA